MEDFNKLFHALPAEIQAMVWECTAATAVDEVPKQPSLDFFWTIYNNPCGRNPSHSCPDRFPSGLDDDYSSSFYYAVKKHYGKGMFSSLFGHHRLEVLKRWRDMLVEYRTPSEAEFVAWRERQPPSEEKYQAYVAEDFDDWLVDDFLKPKLDFNLENDIRRETEWEARVEQYGGIEEAIPQDLDDGFIRKIMDRKHEKNCLEEYVWDLELPRGGFANNFGFYEAFQRAVNEEYSGGGLAGARRAACLKAWRDAVAEIEVSDEPEDEYYGDSVQDARDHIEEYCGQAIRYEWGKQYGLKMVLPPTHYWATMILTG